MDIPDRFDLEKQYARLLAKLLQAYGGRLLEKLGDPPDFNNIPAEFWDDEAKELISKLSPFGERVYLDAARRLLTTSPIGVDWALVNTNAVEWSRRYVFDLVTRLTETNRELLRRSVSAYFEQGLTRGDLESRILAGGFGPVRAEMIAVTEVTRAASEGEQAVARELAKEGLNMIPVWQTNNDEIARRCPVCWPRHNKPIEDGKFPPGHPRCRCWVNHELPKVSRA